jgi:signal transduction histidine kinase
MMGISELRSSSAPDVLGHLLHSLCQPLTTLRCSLELSLDEFTGRQCESVSVALEQADRAIETVQLMREYLELERALKPTGPVALTPAVVTVLHQISFVAEARQVPLLLSGTCSAIFAINEFWLHRALRYLVGSLLENQPPGNVIAVLLEDRPSRSLLSVYCLPCSSSADGRPESKLVGSHLRQARIEIARRVLESAGASVESCSGGKPGFIVCIPQTKALAHRLSA